MRVHLAQWREPRSRAAGGPCSNSWCALLASAAMSDAWQTTACILCSVNCGIEVQLDGRRIVRVRGDRAHPGSRGYACEKA